MHVQVNGETIVCTTEHSFYVQGKGWVAAQDLKPNDELELIDGEDAFVDAVRYEKLDKPIPVFNFEVEGFHTYFVGVDCVLVHNKCKGNWGKGSFDTPDECEDYHYRMHGNEVAAKTMAEYTKKATNFANEVLQKKSIKPFKVGGRTNDVFRYVFNGKYVDLHNNGIEHLLISYGKR